MTELLSMPHLAAFLLFLFIIIIIFSDKLNFIWSKMRTAAQETASQIAEKLLQSGSGEKSIYKVLVKGEFNTMKHSFYKRFFVSHEDLITPEGI